MLKRLATMAMVCVAVSMLAACGGKPTPNPSPSLTPGVYGGSMSTWPVLASVVLPNSYYYGFYGVSVGSTFNANGLIAGQGSPSNGTYTATISDYPGSSSAGAVSGTLTATYTSTTLSGQVVEIGGGAPTISGTVLSTTYFNFATPASLAAITGSWSGNLSREGSASLSISSAGAISGVGSGCYFTGTVIPDTARNYYTASITFTGASCAAPNQTLTGIAVIYAQAGGSNQLLIGVAANNGSGSFGDAFSATR